MDLERRLIDSNEGRVKFWGVYKGILEVMSKFGYFSSDDVMAGFGLRRKEALERIRYLVEEGLIKGFPSLSTPKNFYCLTGTGVNFIRMHRISDEIYEFHPSKYSLVYQHHNRTIAHVYLALKKIFGSTFQGWVGERVLRRTESHRAFAHSAKQRRVLDGLFQIQIQKEKYTSSSVGQNDSKSVTTESWWCGLEVELTVKSASRYQRQFKDLTSKVYDSLAKKQTIPLVLFLCGTEGIMKQLIHHRGKLADSYGRCFFVFGLVDQFIRELGSSQLSRFLGRESRTIPGR